MRDPTEFFAFFDLWKWENPFRIMYFQTGLCAPLIVPKAQMVCYCCLLQKRAVAMSSLGLRNSISQFSVNTSMIMHK